jgi:hypothetical protein
LRCSIFVLIFCKPSFICWSASIEYYPNSDYYIASTLPGIYETPEAFDEGVEATKAKTLNMLVLEPEIFEKLTDSLAIFPHVAEEESR